MFASSRRRAEIVVFAALAGALLSPACELPEYQFVEAPEMRGAEAPTARPTCKKDADCAHLSTTLVCDVRSSECVQCIAPASSGSSVSPSPSSAPLAGMSQRGCGAGQYCDVNRCSIGCTTDLDCSPGLSCDPISRQCTGCSSDAECRLGTGCAESRCVPTCNSDAGCPAGYSCCGGECAHLGSNPLHCGACQAACADTEDCLNGICLSGARCAEGFADCDGERGNGCETNLARDRAHCGACNNDCRPDYCSGGRCSKLECPAGRADCDFDASNACEVDLSRPENCGSCEQRCSSVHGTPNCVDQSCQIVCDIGYEDCDQNSATGCETKIADDPAHCGACTTVCVNAHGTTRCREGSCEPECAQGYASCDGDPANGCETDVRTDLLHCGSCEGSCAPQHATASCQAGVCKFEACEPGYEDCDGDPRNGCEADLSSIRSCGRCGNTCSDNGGSPSCVEGECRMACDPGRADCSGGLLDGCETNLRVSVRNCGSCGTTCAGQADNSPVCQAGVCSLSNCREPLADCLSDEMTGGAGCETNTSTDPKHCGGCGIECFFPHGFGQCVDKECVLTECETGFADCKTEQAGCETQLGNTNNCGRCGQRCVNAHGATSCTAGACAPICEQGWGDCDGMPENGCETQLNTANDCAACGQACARRNATTSCAQGFCEIVACADGFGDCDDEFASRSGCETRLNTTAHCGACGATCSPQHAVGDCRSGTCVLTSCEDGYADCSQVPGCETQLGTNTNCAECGNACQTDGAHVSANVCTGAAGNWDCAATCLPGYGTCDGNPDNGCEAQLDSPEHCGGCGIVCKLPHTTAHVCEAGACGVAECEPAFGDCNGAGLDGCEHDVSTDPANCGRCGLVCSNQNGRASCASGRCSIQCAAGFGDCNLINEDGCEQETTSDPQHCGACGVACTGATPFCREGLCNTRLEIVVVNSSTAGTRASGTGPLTLRHALATPKGTARSNYRAVLVGVASRGNGVGAIPRAPTYAGMPMTLLKDLRSSNQAWVGIYSLLDAELPTNAGTYDVVVTPNDVHNLFALSANVVELSNVEQATGLLDVSGGSNGGSCQADVPSDSVTPRYAGDLIYSALSIYQGGGGAPRVEGRSSQTLLLPSPIWANQLAFSTALVPSVMPVARSVEWGVSACSATAHVLVAIKPTLTP